MPLMERGGQMVSGIQFGCGVLVPQECVVDGDRRWSTPAALTDGDNDLVREVFIES